MSLYACQKSEGNSPGSEYMPDMAHSLAVEATTYNYYFANTWNDESVLPLKETSMPRLPVKGTVAIGLGNPEAVPNDAVIDPYGFKTYFYEDSEAGRTKATEELLKNPFPITEAGIAKGKELYDVFCAICHGSKGKNGDGIYASNIYPLAPGNLVGDSLIASSSPGRYYHAIMYGKNAMGAYKDKISYEERWQVIHYIRSLQAKDRELAYNAAENTWTDYATPYGVWKTQKHDDDTYITKLVEGMTTEFKRDLHTDEEAHHDEGTHENGNHSTDSHTGEYK